MAIWITGPHWSDEIEGCDGWRAHARKFATRREAWRDDAMKPSWCYHSLRWSKDRRVRDTLRLIDNDRSIWSVADLRAAILREFPDGPFISEPEAKEPSIHDARMKEAAHIEVWRQEKDHILSEARVPKTGRIVIEMGDMIFAVLMAIIRSSTERTGQVNDEIDTICGSGAASVVVKTLGTKRIAARLFGAINESFGTVGNIDWLCPAPPKDCTYDSEGATVYSLNHPRRLSESELEAMLAEVRRRKEEA